MRNILRTVKTILYFIAILPPIIESYKKKKLREIEKIIYDRYQDDKKEFLEIKRRIMNGLETDKKICSNCGSLNNKQNDYCQFCGLKFNKGN